MSIYRRKLLSPDEATKAPRIKNTPASCNWNPRRYTLRASPLSPMANQTQWRQRRQRRRLGQEPRRLQVIKSALGEMARVAFAEPFMIAVERQEIYLRKLPPALDGFRIVHLSDLHYGPLVDRRHL